MNAAWITPDWPAPPGIRAYSTLRTGGGSQGGYAGFNLAAHVGDKPAQVVENRRCLHHSLQLPAEPFWLQQVHGCHVVKANAEASHAPEADASYSDEPGVVCVVMTADCLPVLFCHRQGGLVAASHAGWRGLAGGVLEATVEALGTDDVMAWLGPAIGPSAFEVGGEVREAFLQRLGDCHEAFTPLGGHRWLADLYRLARLTLNRIGINAVYGGGECTYTQTQRYFSYRRDSQTGRMASLIWQE